MKILIINPPAHLPTTYPYSLVSLKSELSSNLDEKVETLDLNALYHFKVFNLFYQKINNNNNNHFSLLKEFNTIAKADYSKISKLAINNTLTLAAKISTKEIIKKNPDVLAISVIYNNQIFIAKQIIDSIKKSHPDIKIVIGGPADYFKIIKGVNSFNNSKEFIKFLISIGAKKQIGNTAPPILDYSIFKKENYFTPEIVYPIRTSISCYYKQCTFCTHHANKNFKLLDLSTLESTIRMNNIKKICFIDDDIPPIRLKQISSILQGLGVIWWCQLRPTKQIQSILKTAFDSGLRSVAWGIESGNQRILDLMKKGTNLKDAHSTLELSSKIGIKNMAYILFGFPTETKSEFKDTINFLELNKHLIDIVSPSVFGLQYGSKVIKSPKEFDISNINFEARTFLSDKITYETKSGLNKKEIKQLMKQYKHKLQSFNKVPSIISVYKEQILNFNN